LKTSQNILEKLYFVKKKLLARKMQLKRNRLGLLTFRDEFQRISPTQRELKTEISVPASKNFPQIISFYQTISTCVIPTSITHIGRNDIYVIFPFSDQLREEIWWKNTFFKTMLMSHIENISNEASLTMLL
jgi:hypothetical protein